MAYELSRQFLLLTGARIPVIQAPMAGVSTIGMAAKVTASGGLGSLPLAAVDLSKGSEALSKQLAEFRSSSGGLRVNLNFFSHDPACQYEPSREQTENWFELLGKSTRTEDIRSKVPSLVKLNVSFRYHEEKNDEAFKSVLAALIEFRPAVVSFHFGHPSQNTIHALQDGGIAVFVCVTSVAEAQEVIGLKVDGLILQGYEAGGHRGNFLTLELFDENLSTFALFTQIKRLVNSSAHQPLLVPAGGIVDGKTAAYYLRLGAAAVQLGTAFIPTPESSANDFIAKAIEKKLNIPTIMTDLVSGKPARTLRTPFIEQLVQKGRGMDLPSYGYSYSGFKKLVGLLKDENLGFYLAGQNYHLVKTGLTTEQVVQTLEKELIASGYTSGSGEKNVR